MHAPAGSTVSLAELQEEAAEKLLTLLSSHAKGKKSLILDRNLSGPLGNVVKYSALQERGIDRIYYLENGPLNVMQRNVVYLCRPTICNLKWIVAHVKDDIKLSANERHDFTLLLVPGQTILSDRVLEEAGVVGDIRILSCSLMFFVLDQDLISLELSQAFDDLFCYADYTSIDMSALALMEFQRKYGIFPRITGKGDKAHRLAYRLIHMRKETAIDDPLNGFSMLKSNMFESLVIIDRGVDLITPLLTQLTYEGLLDEVYGIENGAINIDAALITGSNERSKINHPEVSVSSVTENKRALPLDVTDSLYSELRYANFATVGSHLNKIARRLNTDYEGRHQATTVAGMKQFVSKLGGLQAEHQSLRLHTSIAEDILKQTKNVTFKKSLEIQQNLIAGIDPTSQLHAIEELVHSVAPEKDVLRLYCLLSVISKGLRMKDYNNFRRDFLRAYGYHHIVTFQRLECCGLFTLKNSKFKYSYNQVRKSFNLIVDNLDESNPNDIAYVYSGYAPLSCRLLQCIFQKSVMQSQDNLQKSTSAKTGLANFSNVLSWKGFEEPLKLVDGRTFDDVQKSEEIRMHRSITSSETPKPVVVFFLGGCTYTEIAAMRYIASNIGRRIIIATTGILNGKKVVTGVHNQVA